MNNCFECYDFLVIPHNIFSHFMKIVVCDVNILGIDVNKFWNKNIDITNILKYKK